MKSTLTTLGVMALATGLIAAPTRAVAGGSAAFAVPEGGLVLDGGDVEANPFLEGPVPAAAPTGPVAASLAALDTQPAPAPRPLATLPLFATQVVLGQKLYDGDASDSVRSAHTAVAVGTGVLFGVNTVTGVWNLVEGRKDPNRKTKVKVHGILMLLADAGFAATGFLAPETEYEDGFESTSGVSRSTHRAIALSSMGVATVAYLVMLLGR
jgi:hypothetical protein